MRSELEKYGVSIIALSKDSVEDAAVHKERDSLSFTLLSDEKLKVIRQYGVEHHKAFGFKTDTFTLFGIPIPLSPPSFKMMAIPTTLLIDEHGTIRWIDQSDDYRIRSDNELVFAAVREVFDEAIKV